MTHPTEPADAMATIRHLRAENQKLRDAIQEATDPDFIWGALSNVHDMDTTLGVYARAVSRAIRKEIQEPRT